MFRAPVDIFDEMDEMVSRMFSRMDRKFMPGNLRSSGYRIVIGNGDRESGIMKVPQFPAGSAHEPVVEVHHVGDEIKVITELPGATEDAIRLEVRGNTLIIDAGDAENHYHTTAGLPPVDPASMQKSYRHGILEVTFRTVGEKT